MPQGIQRGYASGMFVNWSSPLIRTPISLERVLQSRTQSPKRIHFATTHCDVLQAKNLQGRPDIVGALSLPFAETIKPIFEADTGLDLFKKVFPETGIARYWRSVRSTEEFNSIEGWIKSQGSRVFLRDCLGLSVALDVNITDADTGVYTPLGWHEHEAKATAAAESIEYLAQECSRVVTALPFYRDAPNIAAVPPMSNKGFDLPTCVADSVARSLGKKNLTGLFICPRAKEKSLKEAAIEEKWAILEATGLCMKESFPKGEDVILIDDKYQSGTTMQYVAMKLQDAGARHVFGISLVKTLRDTDNAQ